MKVFITGDRSLNPVAAVAVVAQVIVGLNEKYADEELQIVTGRLESGVERAVRYLVPNVLKTATYLTAEGYTDFDARHNDLAGDVDLAVLIHPSPLESRVGASLAKSFADEKLVIV